MRLINAIILFNLILTPFFGLPSQSINPVPEAESTDYLPWFENAQCMFKVPQGMIEGSNIQCGYLHVPEEHKNPDGPSIRLAVAIIKSMDPNPHADPLVMAQGGPGGSTIDTYITQLFSSPYSFVKDRDIILLEQRGTYFSDPSLNCSEILDQTITTLDEDLTLQENTHLYEEAVKNCHDRLVAQGINLSAFNSIENASDIESLRTALGIEKINLYGVSYGTLLALHTINNHPQGMRSVILDAVVPPQINFILESPHSQDRAFTEFFAACVKDEDCNKNYPDLEKIYWNTAEKLKNTPAEIVITDFDSGKKYPTKINGDSFMNSIFQMLYSTELIPLLPKIIYDASQDKFDFLQRILGLFTFDRTMNYGMYYSVLCAEDADFSGKDVILPEMNPDYANYEKENISSFLRTCQQWDVLPLDPSIDNPVQSDIPTLILNGNFDPITPPAFGQEAAKTLSRSFLVTFPTGGHGAAMSGKCQNEIIQTFLDNPDQKPDISCIEENPSPRFMTKTNTILLPVIGKLVNLEGNCGWQYLVTFLAILFMLGAPLIWFVIWIIRLLSKKIPSTRTRFSVFLQWIASITGILLAAFLAGLSIISLKMALQNNILVLYGLPSTVKGIFLLPLIASVFTLIMAAGSIISWKKNYWSKLNRIYYSLVTLAAFACLWVFANWNMLFAFLQ